MLRQYYESLYAQDTWKANLRLTPCISYLNKAAFSIPDLGTYGNMRYGTVTGPGLIQLNMAVSRTFPIGEKRTL